MFLIFLTFFGVFLVFLIFAYRIPACTRGDDVRNIDWNVTARYNEPFVKVFEEERELTMMLMADISGSVKVFKQACNIFFT